MNNIITEICGTRALLLVEIYRMYREIDTEITISELRKKFGTKVYSNIYKLALLELITIENDIIKLTEKGEKISKCLYNCFNTR